MPLTQNEKQQLDIAVGVITASLEFAGIVLGNPYLEPISLTIAGLYGVVDYIGFIPEGGTKSKFDRDFEKIIKNSIEEAIKNVIKSDEKELLENLQAHLKVAIKKEAIDYSVSKEILYQKIINAIKKITETELLFFSKEEINQLFDRLYYYFLLELSKNPEIQTFINDQNYELLKSHINKIFKLIENHEARITELEKNNLYSNINFLNPPFNKSINFIGRENELEQYKKILLKSNLIISGLGGIGKTEFLRALAEELHDKYKQIVWFEYQSDLKNTLLKDINIKDEDDIDHIFSQRKNFLLNLDSTNIIFFDNVKNLNDNNIKFFNQLKCRVLLSTRQKLNISSFIKKELKFLSINECKKLFLKYSNYKIHELENELLEDIIFRTGSHTLTIELLGKILKNSNSINSIQDLKNELIKNKFDLQSQLPIFREDETKALDFYHHMSKLFNISEISNPIEIKILKNSCIFSDLRTPIEIFFQWSKINTFYKENLFILEEYGWLKIENGYFSLHSVLAETLKISLSISFYDIENLLTSVITETKKIISCIETFNSSFFTHGLRLAEFFYQRDIEDEKIFFLYENIAKIYHEIGFYYEALRFYEMSLEIGEKLFNEKNNYISLTKHNIALELRYLGKFHESISWFNEAIKLQKKYLGENDLITAASYHDKAIVHMKLGEYQDALSLFYKALKIRKDVLSEENDHTLTVYHNIARVYTYQGKYEEALELFQKELKSLINKYGEDNISVATTYNNIALVYDKKNNLKEALYWFYKSLEIYENILGFSHPFTATAYHNIGGICTDLKIFDKAYEFIEKSRVIREKKLGIDHPDTALTFHNFGLYYMQKGNLNQSLKYFHKAIKILDDKKIYNSDYFKFKNNLRKCYLALGYTEEEFTQYLSNLLSNSPPPPTQT